MIPYISSETEASSTPIIVVEEGGFENWLEDQPDRIKGWVKANDFKSNSGNHLLLPGDDGSVSSVLFIQDMDSWHIWSLSSLPGSLPAGVYRLEADLKEKEATEAAIGWSLSTYVFDRYKDSDQRFATLQLPAAADEAEVARLVFATNLARDLINIPTADMGPRALEAAASQIAGEFEARQTNVVGEDLLTYHYPMVHAVGRASAEAPRLIDMV